MKHSKPGKMVSMAILAFLIYCIPDTLKGQWLVKTEMGPAIPITGYNSIVKQGILVEIEGNRSIGNKGWGVGGSIGWARFRRDKNPSDAFQQARLDLIPILATCTYEVKSLPKVKPYISAGLGIIMYNLNYETSPANGQTVFNVSFSLSPRFGISYVATNRTSVFIQGALTFVADGPPKGVPMSDKITGYTGITAGISYKFIKRK